jgi:hypothetical protein
VGLLHKIQLDKYGGKRHVMVPAGQLMAQSDSSGANLPKNLQTRRSFAAIESNNQSNPLLFGSGKYQKKTDIPSKPIFRASGLTSGAKIRQVACIGFVSEMVPEKSIFGRFSI